MIGVLSQGRMGNQMFQLAFAYVASKKLNTDFFIFNDSSLNYFEIENDFEKRNKRNSIKFVLKNIFKKSTVAFSFKSFRRPLDGFLNWGVNKNGIEWNNTLESQNYLLTDIKDNTFYKGFFQCDEYYRDYVNEVRNLFEIKSVYQKKFLEKKVYMSDRKNVVLHIRRQDYISHGADELGGVNVALPLNYYRKCLLEIKQKDECNIIFVSDDIEFVKQEFGTAENYFYENNDEITDFQILLNADILIIANSSYSWWAAWLNKKSHKQVYAPNYFLGFKVKNFYPAGIKVNSWKWMDVN